MTDTIGHHLVVLKKVFKVLVENKFELQLSKCHLLLKEIDFLGYKVSANGVKTTDRGIEAVCNFSVPKNVKGVQSFLGLVSYFRKFIGSF